MTTIPRKLAIDAARAVERRGARLTFLVVTVLLNVLTASDSESLFQKSRLEWLQMAIFCVPVHMYFQVHSVAELKIIILAHSCRLLFQAQRAFQDICRSGKPDRQR